MSRFFVCLFIWSTVLNLEAKTGRFRAMWRDDPATSMVIGWDQMSGTLPMFHYDEIDNGAKVELYKFKRKPDYVHAARSLNNHFVRLTGLKPNTTYYFILKDSEGISRRYSFHTMPNVPSERLCIVSGGDSRNNREARIKANSLVAKIRPHFILFNGDMTASDIGPEWQTWLDDWQATIGSDGRIFPVVVARGNHEMDNRSLQEIFDIPYPEAYYALSFGGNLLRLLTLNTMAATGGDQKNWLQRELMGAQGFIWRFAQYHHAMRPHTSGKPERDDLVQNWAPLFLHHRVQLALESDSHVAKWTYPIRVSKEPGSSEGFIRDDERGTVYVGEGCWGAPLRSSDDNKKWTRNSGSFNHFNLIYVDQEKIEVRAVITDQLEGVMESRGPFVLPVGIKLWEPSNGNVVVIQNKKPLLAQTKPAEPALSPAEATEAATNEREWAKLNACAVDRFSNEATVPFTMGQGGEAQICVYNTLKKEVDKQIFPNLPAGKHLKKINLNQLKSGRYLIVVRAGGQSLAFFQYLR
jgi:hypothetical protein